MSRKLFIVDPQNDFMDNGSLPVKGSLQRMQSLADYLMSLPLDYYGKIYVSLDWHPINHCSFTEQGGPWPTHCVAFTQGALVTDSVMQALRNWMKADKVEFILKGKARNREEYSSLDNTANAVHLKAGLTNVEMLDVCGVVGTVCVQNTLKGLLQKVLPAERITVLPAYTAQFDAEGEARFMEWLKVNGIRWKDNA